MIMLDSHIAVWLLLEPERLSKTAATAIRESGLGSPDPVISCVSLYEIAWTIRRGRIRSSLEPAQFLNKLLEFVRVIPFDEIIASTAAQLPLDFPSDPMDRLIAATASVYNVPLVTADFRIRGSGSVPTIW
ncbi:MAG TPA: type II toxin-antitoxin system VapC family toxin [Silvibacterium sp.]|nr:type II toxin-antitoxin system VapC family toxin [Silvibacterium sp.]